MHPRIESRSGGDLENWDDLRLFLAAYRSRSLTAAAKELGIDQSTASRRLLKLERDLGARLFDRVPGGLQPTSMAAEVIGPAEAAEEQVHRLSRAVAGADSTLQGTVRIAVLEALDSRLIIPKLTLLQARYPGVVLEIVASPVLANLARREADMALRLVRPTGGELVAKRVGQLSNSVWGLPEQVERGLARADWVDWDARSTLPPEAAWLAQHRPPERVRLRTNRLEGKLAGARAGLGLAVLPDALARLHPELRSLPVDPPPPAQPIWLVGHRKLLAVPRIRAVWSFLEQLARTELDGHGLGGKGA